MNTLELRKALKNAKKRNSDAYDIIGAFSGLGKKKIKDIANGKIEPTDFELTLLSSMSTM